MAEVQYATKGKGDLGVTLGAIGTGAALLNNGLLGNLLGTGNTDPGDRPVTRYEMDLIRDSMAKDSEIAALKAQQYSDSKAAGLQAQICQQAVWNATQEGLIRCQAERIAQLYTLTQLVVPNGNVMPGWGGVTVMPTFAAPPAADAAAAKGAKA